LGNTNLDTKAAGNQIYSLPSSGGNSDGDLVYQRGGSFKFVLGDSMFADRYYNAVSILEGTNGGASESSYPWVSFPEGEVLFVNDSLADGIFEYRIEADNVLFNKYYGFDSSGDELARPPITNGTAAGEVSVRFNLDTDLLQDSDNVAVDLNEVTETTGKALLVNTISGQQILSVDNLLDAFEIRSGRIRLVNSVSAELDTEVGIVSEYYAGDNNWVTNELDGCNTYDSANLAFMYVQNTISGTPSLGGAGIFENGIGDGADAMTISIGGFTDENTTGNVDLGYKIPAEINFLQYQWCATSDHVNSVEANPNPTSTETVSCRNPKARYTFGQERGNDRIIHWREVLR
jgi:hypothetical protein